VSKITFSLILLLLAGSMTACGPAGFEDDVHREWRAVLELKKQAESAPDAERAVARQAWAAALLDFTNRYPEHDRAQTSYKELQLDFARLKASRGRYDEAIRHYRAVLQADPGHETAQAELDLAERRRFVTADAVAALRRGMTKDDVSERIGVPAPGWSRRLERDGTTIDSWYYPRRDGGVAGVFFRNGELFAAEFDRPMNSGG
jgi:tetratricopeptide (TPR) repeat protein